MNTYSLYFQSVDDLIEVCVALGNSESVETILSTNFDTDENRIRMTHELEDFDCGNLDTHELVHSVLQTFTIKDHTSQNYNISKLTTTTINL
jgi:DNA-binding transcriptional regulator YbjK